MSSIFTEQIFTEEFFGSLGAAPDPPPSSAGWFLKHKKPEQFPLTLTELQLIKQLLGLKFNEEKPEEDEPKTGEEED